MGRKARPRPEGSSIKNTWSWQDCQTPSGVVFFILASMEPWGDARVITVRALGKLRG